MEAGRGGPGLVVGCVYVELLLMNVWSVTTVSGLPVSPVSSSPSTTTATATSTTPTSVSTYLHHTYPHPPSLPSQQQQQQSDTSNNALPNPASFFSKSVPENLTLISDVSAHKLLGSHVTSASVNPRGSDGELNVLSKHLSDSIAPVSVTQKVNSTHQWPQLISAELTNTSGVHVVPVYSSQSGDQLTQPNEPSMQGSGVSLKTLKPDESNNPANLSSSEQQTGQVIASNPSQLLLPNKTTNRFIVQLNRSSTEYVQILSDKLGDDVEKLDIISQVPPPQLSSTEPLVYDRRGDTEDKPSHDMPHYQNSAEQDKMKLNSSINGSGNFDQSRQSAEGAEIDASRAKEPTFLTSPQANLTDVQLPAAMHGGVVNNSKGVSGRREDNQTGSPPDDSGDNQRPPANSTFTTGGDITNVGNYTNVTSQRQVSTPPSAGTRGSSVSYPEVSHDSFVISDVTSVSDEADTLTTMLTTGDDITDGKDLFDEEDGAGEEDEGDDGDDGDDLDEDESLEYEDGDDEDYDEYEDEDEYYLEDGDDDSWYYGIDDDEEKSVEMEEVDEHGDKYDYEDSYGDYMGMDQTDYSNAHRKKDKSKHRISAEIHENVGEIFLNAHGFTSDHASPIKATRINRVMRRPMGSRQSHETSMSLLVFYTWLAIVCFMAIVALVGFKNRHRLVGLFWEKKIGYRRSPRTVGIEEGHTLLSHQHV